MPRDVRKNKDFLYKNEKKYKKINKLLENNEAISKLF